MTPRQRECLRAITDLTDDGVPPTIRAVAERLGLSSTSSAHRMIHALATQKHVELTPGANQSIRVVGADFAPDRLGEMTDKALRLVVAHAAGLLAHREGGYGPETAEMLRRVADRLVRAQ